ncbi:hypothetical protein AVANS_0714 [Campylobacter sp. RM5004]|uniref:DUF4376 domain-containing protein n=1 Tax=Campylobacter sp. RM5004 TaxID=1660078 RepID=UPI001EFAE63A|nr:DUF4376 domain-containing protein [Campylobacter sp. RM5004]ULO01344.1 hypothetical protein AVANS_0714 [Campylobacter sp. RM5004]
MEKLNNLIQDEIIDDFNDYFSDEKCFSVVLKDNGFIDYIDMRKLENAVEVSEETYIKIMQNQVNFYEKGEFIHKAQVIELSFDELKENKLNELENTKTQAENADILYKDKLYQADSKAKELLTQSLVIFSSVGAVPDNFVWKSSDNSLNVFSLDDLKNLSLLIAQRTQEITAKYWSYKEQIRNATTSDELDLIKLEF